MKGIKISWILQFSWLITPDCKALSYNTIAQQLTELLVATSLYSRNVVFTKRLEFFSDD